MSAFTAVTQKYLLQTVLFLMGMGLCVACAMADEYTEVSTLIQAGQLSEARDRTERMLTLQPRDPQLRFMLGIIQRNSAEPQQAIDTLSRLVEDYPELPEPYNNLAALYAEQGRYEQARSALEMAIRVNPGYALAYENLGDIQARLASQAYEKALQLKAEPSAINPKLAAIRALFGPGKPPAGTAADLPR